MNKKAIFLDIDGTLTYTRNTVSDLIKEAITKARENGHKVFICTGRNKFGTSPLLELGFDGIVCSAGGYIEVNDELLYSQYITFDEVERVRDIFDRNNILYHLEATNQTYSNPVMQDMFKDMMEEERKQMNSEMRRIIEEDENVFKTVPIALYDENPQPIHKVCFMGFNQQDITNATKELEKDYIVVIHDLFSDKTINGEIIPKGFNKGTGIKKVVDYLNMSMDDTIGFGDSMNDYEMIVTCHDGIVMENGSQELKKYATCICESVYDDGIYHELKRRNII